MGRLGHRQVMVFGLRNQVTIVIGRGVQSPAIRNVTIVDTWCRVWIVGDVAVGTNRREHATRTIGIEGRDVGGEVVLVDIADTHKKCVLLSNWEPQT